MTVGTAYWQNITFKQQYGAGIGETAGKLSDPFFIGDMRFGSFKPPAALNGLNYTFYVANGSKRSDDTEPRPPESDFKILRDSDRNDMSAVSLATGVFEALPDYIYNYAWAALFLSAAVADSVTVPMYSNI